MRSGFTLIELMVVITIIVGLLALLAPAMDQAVYQAELVTCAARLKGGATGALTYAMENRRYYPHREGPRNVNWTPMYLCTGFYDDRPAIFSAIRPDLLQDPFNQVNVNLETQALRAVVYASYCMWFGWRYKPGGNNGRDVDRERGMDKVGDRFTWTMPAGPDNSARVVQRSFNLLMSDQDTIRPTAAHGSHPDREEAIFEFAWVQDDPASAVFWANQGQTLTIAYWRNGNRQDRGLYDTSYAYDDGSVLRFNEVRVGDDRMVYVPENVTTASGTLFGRQVPRP